MSYGKAIAQAGHAFLSSFIDAQRRWPNSAEAYARLTPGTKITLDGGTETHLRATHRKLLDRGVPCSLIIDRDHVEPPDFDGSEVLTALGVGPLTKSQARKLLSSFPLWPGKGGGS